MNRRQALARLRGTLDGGGVIMGAGAGTGLSAKCAVLGQHVTYKQLRLRFVRRIAEEAHHRGGPCAH